jgi:KDO2-lipid IV(A) lauroyltransferase
MKPLLFWVSRLPFPILHRISDVGFLLLYFGVRYRRKTVRENLVRSFPEKAPNEIIRIEKQFYRNFADTLVETIKGFTISREELQSRVDFKSQDVAQELWRRGVNVAGISSHLANWEFIAQSISIEFQHLCLGVYKPLSDPKMNEAVVASRERFGMKMVPIRGVRRAIADAPDHPWLLGLLSDQAPHDYDKAFEVEFLGQKTYVVPGPGVLTVKLGLVPMWGGMRRTGRSRFEWWAEILTFDPPAKGWTEGDRAQMERISRAHRLSREDAEKALALILNYTVRLEAQIKMAPQDWLWSHRRWKNR